MRRVTLLFLACAVYAGDVHAQGFGLTDDTPSIDVKLNSKRIELKAETPATLIVQIAVPEGHHAYLDRGEGGTFIPIHVDLSAMEKAGIRARQTGRPEGEQDSKVNATVLRRDGAFAYELTVLPGAEISTTVYDIKIRSQICNDISGTCYFPETDTRRIEINILSVPDVTGGGSGSPNAVKANNDAAATTVYDSEADIDYASIDFPAYSPRTVLPTHGLLGWMLLAFVAGMLLNVMPCVLPVVSIKVLSFVQQAGESRRRVLALGTAFAIGMMAVFMALALLAILFGLGWGEQFQSQTFMIVMIAVVFAFALSLFGVFELGVPGKIGVLAGGAPREGIVDAFLKGIMATVLATPCSGPFLGSTLTWTLGQPPMTVLLVFGMLGLGMALPYVILTANPALLKLLPRPGAWMETFKHVMGFLLLATAVYLMISLDQKLLLFTVAFLLFVAMACGIWGRFSPRASTRTGRTAILTLSAAVLVLGAHLSFVGFRGLFGASSNKANRPAWERFDTVRLSKYHEEKRSVLVDFMADWCANCKFNEIRVFHSPEIRRLMRSKNVVLMKADLTREGPRTDMLRRFMNHLGARSVPFLAVFPGDQPMRPYTRYDLLGKNDMRDILNGLPDS